MNIIRRIAAAAKAGYRAFDAAGGSGRWPKESMMFAQSRQSLAARPILAARSQYLIENSPSARAIQEIWADALIGDGPSARSNHPNETIGETLEAAWGRFYAVADIEGGDLCEFLRRSVRVIVANGEAFVRLLATDNGELRLQLLATEQIDPSKNVELADGTRIINGIEIGPNGERLAYWVRPQAPDTWISFIGPPVRIDASEIMHILDPRFAGMVRGISWISAVATRLLELDGLEDALLARMKTAALFAGFISDSEGAAGFGDTKRNPEELSLEPGTMRILPPGASVTFPDVPGIEGAPEILKHMLRSIASGSGVPYELLANNLADVNYSSAKLGLEAFRRRCKTLQSSMIVARLLLPVWKRFIALEIVSGRLRAPGFVSNPDDYSAVTFLWPQWASLDPLKDAEADQILLSNSIKSRDQIISERGRDPGEVRAEIAADPIPLPVPKPIAPANQIGRV